MISCYSLCPLIDWNPLPRPLPVLVVSLLRRSRLQGSQSRIAVHRESSAQEREQRSRSCEARGGSAVAGGIENGGAQVRVGISTLQHAPPSSASSASMLPLDTSRSGHISLGTALVLLPCSVPSSPHSCDQSTQSQWHISNGARAQLPRARDGMPVYWVGTKHSNANRHHPHPHGAITVDRHDAACLRCECYNISINWHCQAARAHGTSEVMWFKMSRKICFFFSCF